MPAHAKPSSIALPLLQPLLMWQSLVLLWVCGLLACEWGIPSCVAAVVLIIADSRFWTRNKSCVALIVFGLGYTVAYCALPQRPEALPAWAEEKDVRLAGTVASVQGLPDKRLRILLSNVRPAATADTPPLTGTVVWTWEQPVFRPLTGQRLHVTLPLRPTHGLRNPGVADFGKYWLRQGVFWRIWSREQRGNPVIVADTPAWGSVARSKALHSLEQNLHPQKILTQAQAFLPALLFGDRFYLDTHTMQLMSSGALVHSLALSGQHLALASLAGVVLAWGIGLFCTHIYLRIPRLKLALACSLFPALFYVWLGGAPASLLRAYCMMLLLAYILWRNRCTTTLDVLFAAVLCLTLVWPLGVFDTGLQLSVLCIAALGLVMPFARRIPRPSLGTPYAPFWYSCRFLLQILLASFCIQLALLPVSLLMFSSASPWFILNVCWLPVLGFWVMPLGAIGAAAGYLHMDGLAQICLHLATQPCDLLLRLLQYIYENGWFTLPATLHPHWTLLPAWAALLVCVALLPGRARLPKAGVRLMLIAMLFFAIAPCIRYANALFAPPTLQLLDVGQGQAVSLHVQGHTVLVDGGGSLSPRFDTGRDVVAPSLSYNTAPRLWACIATHPDMDHLRGLGYFLTHWNIKKYYHNGAQPYTHSASDLFLTWKTLQETGVPLYAGQRIPLPTVPWQEPLFLEVLHPPQASPLQGNNRSLVLRLVQGTHGLALLTGDAEKTALRTLLDTQQNLQAEVLILPHHGSISSLLPEFYDAVRPRMALVSCRQGAKNYPHPQVSAALKTRKIPFYTTARHGALSITWEKNTLRPLLANNEE